MIRKSFNDDWYFTKQWDDRLTGISQDKTSSLEAIRLPHTVTLLPFNNFDTDRYQMVSGYIKHFLVPAE